MKENFLDNNWFKLVIVLILLLIIFIVYQQYSANSTNALKQCAEFGANLDKQQTKDLEANGSGWLFLDSEYRFKNNTCYRYVSYTEPTQYHYFIEDPYTKKVVGACSLYRDAGKPITEGLCEQYFKKYDEIFK